MLQNSFGVHVFNASVDQADGSDPRAAARSILVAHRVLASVRDATAEWSDDDQEAVLGIPVTDDGRVLTLSASDTIETELTVVALREAFAAAGLTLWLDAPSDDGDDASDGLDVSFDQEDGESDAVDDVALSDADLPESDDDLTDDIDEAFDESLFESQPVRVSVFSHMGSVAARFLAQTNRATVEHRELDAWSLQRFETTEPTVEWPASKAERPVIEFNRVADGANWIEVTASNAGAVPFWVNSERDTQPVIELSAISVVETATTYLRLMTEGDGVRDELVELARATRLDVDAAHAAVRPEVLGGVVGAEARERAFLAAFGVPDGLLDVAFEDAGAGAGAGAVRRFEPRGWWQMLRDVAVDGYAEATPLTRRDRGFARVARWVRRRPLLGVAITLTELLAGVAGLLYLPGWWKILGGLFVIDALIDSAVWVVRFRRR